MTAPLFITGAGRRVGYALADHFLRHKLPVIAHFYSDSEEIKDLAARGAHCTRADFADRASVQAMLAEITARYQSLRAIIHNASAFQKTADNAHHAMAQFDLFYQVHMASPWLINQSLAPLLSANHEADIIHITDIFADNPNPTFDVYCASKAGVQNLALSFAKQLAPKIKVNVVQPGPILFKAWHSEEAKKQVLRETLLGFEAGPEPIIKAVSAILDNPYQTGAIIAVDGGRRLT